MDEAERLRREFARAWGKIGAAWGVAPSTAMVQGYFLLHGGPLTEAELRRALGLSHRAALSALAECETWGLIDQDGPRRSGRRGPAGRSWVPVGDHWQWFRRVASARKERETDPVLPLLDECLRRAESVGDQLLRDRIASLLNFTRQVDLGVDSIVRSEATAVARLFGVLGRLDESTLVDLVATLATLPDEDLARAATSLAAMRPQLLRQLLRFASHPRLAGRIR